MYTTFNRRNGAFATLNHDGMIREVTNGTMTMDDATAAAFKKMTVGEYTYYGHFVIHAISQGVTTDELKAR